MSDQIRVRLYATCELQVTNDTEVDLEEFREWYEESGGVFDPEDIDTDAIVGFINASPDTEYEYTAQFPNPSAEEHAVEMFFINDAEVLPEESQP